MVKTLAVWRTFTDADLDHQVEPGARTLREQMVHQCVSEELRMRTMLGLDAGLPPLPMEERCEVFIQHYGHASLADPLADVAPAPLPGPGLQPPTERPS